MSATERDRETVAAILREHNCEDLAESPMAARIAEALAAARSEAVASYIDDHAVTCDCCQHRMIDVTAAEDHTQRQHCMAGDPEGEGSACAVGWQADADRRESAARREERERCAKVLEARSAEWLPLSVVTARHYELAARVIRGPGRQGRCRMTRKRALSLARAAVVRDCPPGIKRTEHGFPVFDGQPNRRVRKLWQRLVGEWLNSDANVTARRMRDNKNAQRRGAQ